MQISNISDMILSKLIRGDYFNSVINACDYCLSEPQRKRDFPYFVEKDLQAFRKYVLYNSFVDTEDLYISSNELFVNMHLTVDKFPTFYFLLGAFNNCKINMDYVTILKRKHEEYKEEMVIEVCEKNESKPDCIIKFIPKKDNE